MLGRLLSTLLPVPAGWPRAGAVMVVKGTGASDVQGSGGGGVCEGEGPADRPAWDRGGLAGMGSSPACGLNVCVPPNMG